MGAGVNPVALLLQSLSARQAAPGGGGVPPGGGGGMTDDASGYSQQVAELKGADPGLLARELKAMKQRCAVLMVQNLERLPNVSGQLSKMVPMFDRVLKEIQQAGNVNAAVRNPIQMGAAQPPTVEGQPPAMSNSF